MRVGHHFIQRADDFQALIAQYRDPVRERHQRVEVVRHHYHRQLQLAMQFLDQRHETLAAVGIEAGRRLVEKQQFRL